MPPWVLKIKGQTYYVNHVSFKAVDLSTRETPGNEHTKGSIKCKGYVFISDNNEAIISGAPI